jgi:hypothetical protein
MKYLYALLVFEDGDFRIVKNCGVPTLSDDKEYIIKQKKKLSMLHTTKKYVVGIYKNMCIEGM